MDNVDLVNIDVTDLGPDWKQRFDSWSSNFALMYVKFFHIRVDTVVMNPPFGTKHNKGLDMKFLQVRSQILSFNHLHLDEACILRLAWKSHPELCIHFTKLQPEIMSCPRQRSGGQKEGTSDLLFWKMLIFVSLTLMLICCRVLAELRYDLPATYKHHKKASVDIQVDFIRFTPSQNS